MILTCCAILALDPEIIQPPTDFHTVTFDESTSSVQLMCSLNIDIPSSIMVIWLLNNNFVVEPPNEVTQTGNTATLLIGDPQPSDVGDYACSFMFNELLLRRFIRLGE